MEISSSVAQALPSSIEIYNSAAVRVSEVAPSTPQTVSASADTTASGEEVADSDAVLVNKSMVVSAANIVPAEGATIATSLDQWLTTVNQVCSYYVCSLIYCTMYLFLGFGLDILSKSNRLRTLIPTSLLYVQSLLCTVKPWVYRRENV